MAATGTFGLYFARGYGCSPSLSVLDALSARHSSKPVSADDISTVVNGLQGQAPSLYQTTLSFRLLAGYPFLVPFVKSDDGASLLLTFPEQTVGVFTSDNSFDNVRKANSESRLESMTMSGQEIYNMMEQTSDSSRSESNPKALISKLSIDGVVVIDNWSKSRNLWLESVKQVWTRKVLQGATLVPDLDLAIQKALDGEKSFWCVIERRASSRDPWNVSANDMGGGSSVLLVFCCFDLAARLIRDEDPKLVRIVKTSGPLLRSIAVRQPIGLVHDLLENNQVGCVTVDSNRIARLDKIKSRA